MDHLELVRVHDTGTELVLRAPDGTQFLLAMDEALKRAARDPRPRLGTVTPASTGLSPREIQARIRAGASAAEVAEESGTPLEHILRYEGPVLAEREYIAQQARLIQVSPALGNEGYRAAFGDEPASLGDMVRTRLRSFDVDPAELSWDAWKVDAGTWAVVAHFVLPEDGAAIGEEPPARWVFHPARQHLENANRWGQVLSEWEPWDVLPGQRRLAPVGEATPEADLAEARRQAEAPEPGAQEQALLDVLNRRRGTRVGEDAEGDHALADLIARSHALHEDDEDEAASPEESHGEGLGNVLPGPGREIDDSSWPPLRRVPDPVPATGIDIDDEDGPRPHKKRRSQVPSWDEIVVGRSAKGDDEA